MTELQLGGMKVESVGAMTIERVTHDGTPQTVSMGTMHAQLMGATRLRSKFHSVFADKAIFSYPFFTLFIIHHLVRTIHYIWH